MERQITERKEIIESCAAVAMPDPGTISSGQKAEHYENASYETLRQFAEMIGLTESVLLLESTLNKEKVAAEKPSEIAQSINVEVVKAEQRS